MQNNCIRWVAELCSGQLGHFYLDAPRKRSVVLRVGRVNCCPHAALAVVFPLLYTLLVKAAVFKSFRACHSS